MRVIIPLLAALVGVAGGAQAATLASGPVNGGSASNGGAGGTITCRIFNAGLTSASITSTQIWINTNALVTPTSNSCLTSLGVEKYCAFTAEITGNFAFTCRITAAGTDTNLRGVAEIQGPTGIILNALPMQ
jgi:hypothetical protein